MIYFITTHPYYTFVNRAHMFTTFKIALVLLIVFTLSGCIGEGLCEDYNVLPVYDMDGNGENNYRIQVIGDSILAYHKFSCKSVGHRLGLNINGRVLIRPVTGAKIREIRSQYRPSTQSTDYEIIIVNGGLNDLIADKNPGAPEDIACNCNGDFNHDACMLEIDDITLQMNGIIDDVQATSSAMVALLAYYPPEDEESFVGACFHYIDQLNERYRQLASLDANVKFVETYGVNFPVIQKISQFGKDNYHPTDDGSSQLTSILQPQLGL